MPTLTAWDWFVLVTAVLSVFSGALTGLSRTLAGLAGWVLAVVGTPLAAPALVRAGELHTFEVLVWLGLFIVLLLIGRVGALLIVRAPGVRGPNGADRLAGAMWGLARALVLVVAVLDECLCVLRGGTPSYVARVQERHARGDFSEEL